MYIYIDILYICISLSLLQYIYIHSSILQLVYIPRSPSRMFFDGGGICPRTSGYLGVPVLGVGLTDHKMGNGIEWNIMGYIAHTCIFIYYIQYIYMISGSVWKWWILQCSLLFLTGTMMMNKWIEWGILSWNIQLVNPYESIWYFVSSWIDWKVPIYITPVR